MVMIHFLVALRKRRPIVLPYVDPLEIEAAVDDLFLEPYGGIKDLFAFVRVQLPRLLNMPIWNYEQMAWYKPGIA